MPVTVREATTDDIAGIRQVALRAYPDTYDEQLADETLQSVLQEWYSREELEELMEREDVTVLVAEDSGVVGFCAVSWDPPESELENIYVDPDRQGEGVGSRLLEAALDALPTEVARVGVGLLAANDGAADFYESHGFEKSREVEDDFFGETARCHLYVRDLDR